MTKHKLKDTIGAFINVEASGTGGIGKILPMFYSCISLPAGVKITMNETFLLMTRPFSDQSLPLEDNDVAKFDLGSSLIFSEDCNKKAYL